VTAIADLLDPQAFGTLRGRSGRERAYDFVAAGNVPLPRRGDFALVPDREGVRVLVFRVTGAELTGAFGENSDRGQEFLSNVARYSDTAQVPARVRDLAVRHRIRAVVLGWLDLDPTTHTPRFLPGMRELELFGQPAYVPSAKALDLLANLGIDRAAADTVKLGQYAVGHDVREAPVHFSINRLKGKRTFVFARAGYGKSNLTKLLLSRLYHAEPDVGLLIVDPDGEYAFDQDSETGAKIPGFANTAGLSERVIVFTGRKDRLRAGEPNIFPVGVDLRQITADEFVTLFVGAEKVDQVWVNRLRALRKRRDGWTKLVDLLHAKGFTTTDEELAEVLGVKVQASDDGKRKGTDVSLGAVRNNVVPVIERLHVPNSDMLTRARAWLRGRVDVAPGVVIFDTSVIAAVDAESILRLLVGQVFHESVTAFTEDGNKSGVLLVLEEAQSLLGGARLNDRDIFVRWAKEGRKYGLGAMLITQQPGAIASELLSQGDNFFAMHLLNERDLRSLGEANAHFGDDVLECLRDEPIKGNCYFWSAPSQPYVVPVRVDSYEAVAARVSTQPRRARGPTPRAGVSAAATTVDAGNAARSAEPAPTPDTDVRARTLEWVGDALVRAIASHARIYRYSAETIDGVPVDGVIVVAEEFVAALATNRIDPARLRQGDIERRKAFDYLRRDLMHDALLAQGVLHDPAQGTARLAGREYGVLLLDDGALRRRAVELGVEVTDVPGRATVRTGGEGV
jgi:hypothetical protein